VTYIISEPCIDVKDRSCVDVCPVDCIHEVARMLVIDLEECIDRGACEPECPVEAITPEDGHGLDGLRRPAVGSRGCGTLDRRRRLRHGWLLGRDGPIALQRDQREK
jgi:NAD-dependent dihydropyrimidine dehydrogenase PreA subunit